MPPSLFCRGARAYRFANIKGISLLVDWLVGWYIPVDQEKWIPQYTNVRYWRNKLAIYVFSTFKF